MARGTRRLRGPVAAFAIAVVLGVASYALSPNHSFGAGGYPGPDALPGVPTYGSYLGNIPVGGHSPVSYVCGFDAPNATNHSPKNAVASINGQISAYIPISTQFGCAQFVLYVKKTVNGKTAPCGYAWVSVNGGTWILVHDGRNFLLVTGIKHYHHVGAYFPFYIPLPANEVHCGGPPPTSSTTIPGTTTPTTAPPTTIPGQTTTTAIPNTSTTIPGYRTTTSIYHAGTSTIPYPPNHSPGGVIDVITEVGILVAIAVAVGAAGAGFGSFLAEIPEALVEEYATEIPPGGGLPAYQLPSGGAGTLTEVEAEEAAVLAALDDSVPPGGGLPYGSLAPEASVAEEALLLAPEDGFEILVFALDDEEIPAGGGYPVGVRWLLTGGLVIDERDDQRSGGGES